MSTFSLELRNSIHERSWETNVEVLVFQSDRYSVLVPKLRGCYFNLIQRASLCLCLVILCKMENLPFLSCPDPLPLSCPVLSSSPGVFFGHGFQRSSLPHPHESLTSSLKGEPQAVTQTVTLSCNCCSNFTWGRHGLEWRAEISFHLVSAHLIYSSLHVTPWIVILCVYIHACV